VHAVNKVAIHYVLVISPQTRDNKDQQARVGR
jgi:hypothetical protein